MTANNGLKEHGHIIPNCKLEHFNLYDTHIEAERITSHIKPTCSSPHKSAATPAQNKLFIFPQFLIHIKGPNKVFYYEIIGAQRFEYICNESWGCQPTNPIFGFMSCWTSVASGVWFACTGKRPKCRNSMMFSNCSHLSRIHPSSEARARYVVP